MHRMLQLLHLQRGREGWKKGREGGRGRGSEEERKRGREGGGGGLELV